MTARILFIPLSVEAAPTVIALQSLAATQERSLIVLDQRATDDLVLEQTADLIVIKQIDPKAFNPTRHNITIVLPSGSEAFVQDVANRHPDMTRSWCLIHASEGIATVMWLMEAGALAVPANGLTIDGAVLPLLPIHCPVVAAPEFELYRELYCCEQTPYDVTAQTIANSSHYAPNIEGWHEVSGRASHAVCGPYFFLPSGDWKVDLDLDVDCEGVGLRLFFEWGAPSGHRNNFESVLKESGHYAVTLETNFAHPDAAHCLIATNASHLQGRLRLNRCVVTRLDKSAGMRIPNWA